MPDRFINLLSGKSRIWIGKEQIQKVKFFRGQVHLFVVDFDLMGFHLDSQPGNGGRYPPKLLHSQAVASDLLQQSR